ASLALRQRFEGSELFRVVATAPTIAALEPLFQRGAIDQAVVFEHDFAARLGRDEPAPLLVITNTADPNTGGTMQAYAAAGVQAYERELGERGGGLQIDVETRMRFNPTLESVNLFVPGLIALVLTLVSAMMTAISLAREKERGSLEALLVSPLRPWQIIVGKVIPYLVLGFANVLTV